MKFSIGMPVSIMGIIVATMPSLAQGLDARALWEHPAWWGWGHMMFGGIFMIVFWGLVIALIVFLVRTLWPEEASAIRANQGNRTPREILDERFARGEIDREEYDERKRALSE